MKSAGHIIRDQSMVSCGLDILDGMVMKMEKGERIEIADAAAILKLLQFFGDAEDRVLIAGLAETLRLRRGKDFVRGSRQLGPILRKHIGQSGPPTSEAAYESVSIGTESPVAEIRAGLSRLGRKYSR